MAQDAHISKVGNMERDGIVPRRQYDDKVRKDRSEVKLVNPTDPHQNPNAFSKDAPPVQAPPHRTGSDAEVPKPKDERRTSREDGDQPSESPIRHDPMARKPPSDSPQYRYGDQTNSGDPQRKVSGISGGPDRSIEHSPLHPQYQVKSAGKGGVSSPSWERKGSSEGSHGLAPCTPGRSRLGTGGRGDETPEKSSVVPKFGDWDENNPSSADGYTDIFNKVGEEKKGGSAKVPIISNDSTYLYGGYKQDKSFASTSCGCFGCFKK